MKGKNYDLEKIKSFIDPESVLMYLEKRINSSDEKEHRYHKRFMYEESKKEGEYIILCPNPAHQDKHLGSCHLNEKGYHCFACGAHGDIIDLVKQYLGCGFSEVMRILTCEIYGDAEAFTTNATSSPLRMPTDDVLKTIGIDPRSAHEPIYGSYAIVSIDEYDKNDYPKGHRAVLEDDDQYVITVPISRPPLRVMLEESPNIFRWELRTHAKQRIVELEKMLTQFQDHLAKNPGDTVFIHQCIADVNKDLRICQDICIEYASEKKKQEKKQSPPKEARRSMFQIENGVSL